MATTWDLYDSFDALKLSSSAGKRYAVESSSKANVLPKERLEQKLPAALTDKSKISVAAVLWKDMFM